MKMRPLHTKILVRREEAEETTKGGIILTGTKEKINRGVVVAVGTGKILPNGTLQPLILQKNARVVFGKYSDQNTIDIDGETLLIMEESDIFGVLEE